MKLNKRTFFQLLSGAGIITLALSSGHLAHAANGSAKTTELQSIASYSPFPSSSPLPNPTSTPDVTAMEAQMRAVGCKANTDILKSLKQMKSLNESQINAVNPNAVDLKSPSGQDYGNPDEVMKKNLQDVDANLDNQISLLEQGTANCGGN